MSRNHSATAYDAAHIVSDIRKLSREDVTRLYGIVKREGGKIFDPTYNMEFGSLGEWAAFTVEQDNVEYEEHFHSHPGEF